MQRLIVFAHLTSIATWLGATILTAILVEKLGAACGDAAARRRRYADVFSVYNPLSIGALGVVVMTGAWALTPYKQALGGGYFAEIGSALVGKLALAFLLIIMATWVCFGIGHRLVRAEQGGLPVSDAELARVRARLRVALWSTVAVALITLWVALGIRPPAIAG